ncbi:MAG: pyridoxal phosphate-dependent aminotransferase [Rhodospirillales bacterium]|nr:pyridoxal phosphate-dependent aminotransferase [Rhodospirillales bacterium]
MPGFASRLEKARTAAAVAMTVRARELRAAGADVVQLTIGEPDFPTPPHAIEAAHQAALRGETKYPPQDGTPALKAAVQRKFRREHGLDYDLSQIIVGNGGKQVIFDALLATVEQGDEVLIPTPSWSSYELMTHVVGGTPVFVACPQNNGFRLRPEDLDAAITPRTRWLVLNFPNNPSGAACSRDDLAAIAAVMRKHPHVWIMSDDMYEHLVYDGFDYATLAAVAPDLRDRVLTISGVSKTYAMTGWRIGFAAGPRDLIRAMVNMQGQATAGVSTVGQAAAAAVLDGPQDLVAERAAIYRRRRDMVVDMLNDVPGIACHRPEGTFYVFPNIAGCLGRVSAGGRRLESDEDFAKALLEEQHVATVHGAAFGMSPYLRISYATDEASLEKGCRRIADFVAGLR